LLKRERMNKEESRIEIKSSKVKIFTTIFAISFFTVMFLPSSVLAVITCPSCQVGSCSCTVGVCGSGIFSVYNNAGCSGDPISEYTFSSRNVPWAPDTTGTYYVQAYCDDGVTLERCIPMSVSSLQPTATTSEEITTETSTTGTGGGFGGGVDMTWIIVAIIIVIAIIAFVVYRLFFTKKKSKGKTYEELYRKWGGRGGMPR
jgi:hypothetical protein